MITKDKDLICSILGECEDDHEGSITYIDHPLFIYLYVDGCLFPASVELNELNIHAAIPKQYRGRIAINAARKVLEWALKKIRFKKVRCQIPKRLAGNRATRLFVNAVGAVRSGENEKYYFYEAING